MQVVTDFWLRVVLGGVAQSGKHRRGRPNGKSTVPGAPYGMASKSAEMMATIPRAGVPSRNMCVAWGTSAGIARKKAEASLTPETCQQFVPTRLRGEVIPTTRRESMTTCHRHCG
jgi:hypothetical protein